MTIIAAITKDGALGKDGDMIYHLSADLRRFKEITMGHPVVMGRRTFESLRRPLPGRRNIVVSRNPAYRPQGTEVFPTFEAALAACEGCEAMIIGGGQIYAMAMPMASKLHITEIDATAPDADTFFPAISPSAWTAASIGEWLTDAKTGIRFRYIDYTPATPRHKQKVQ